MDLPTYTNIWRIEKRLYKLYDFRLPMPLPVGTFGVALGVFALWVVLLSILNAPFAFGNGWHLVLWVVPPGVITVLATRPVIEGKRLTELLISQARFLAEARVYTRLAPEYEPSEVRVAVRVWHRDPEAGPLAMPGRGRAGRRAVEFEAEPAEVLVEDTAPLRPVPEAAPPLRGVAEPVASAPALVDEPVYTPAVPERAPAEADPEHGRRERTPVRASAAPALPAAPELPVASGHALTGRAPEEAAAPAREERVPVAVASRAEPGDRAPAQAWDEAPRAFEADEGATGEPGRPEGPSRGVGRRVLNYFGWGLGPGRPDSPEEPDRSEDRERDGGEDGFGDDPVHATENDEQRASDAWFANLRASSGETPVGLTSKSAYSVGDTGALSRDEVADAVSPAGRRTPVRDRGRTEEVVSGHEPDPADETPAARRLRGRTQGIQVAKDLEERRTDQVRERGPGEQRPVRAQGLGLPEQGTAPAGGEGRAQVGRAEEHPRRRDRPHAAPWDLGTERGAEEPAEHPDLSDYAARFAAATGRPAAETALPWLPPASAAPAEEDRGDGTEHAPQPASEVVAEPDRAQDDDAARSPKEPTASQAAPTASEPAPGAVSSETPPAPADRAPDAGTPAEAGPEPQRAEDTALRAGTPRTADAVPALELDHGTGEQDAMSRRPEDEPEDRGPEWNAHMSVLDRHLITADTPAPPRPKFADAVPGTERETPRDPAEWFEDGKRRHPDQPKVGDRGNPVIPASELREDGTAEPGAADASDTAVASDTERAAETVAPQTAQALPQTEQTEPFPAPPAVEPKPPTQLDHGTGELVSFAEVRDEPERSDRNVRADPGAEAARRRTVSDLEEAEAAALARRRAAAGHGTDRRSAGHGDEKPRTVPADGPADVRRTAGAPGEARTDGARQTGTRSEAARSEIARAEASGVEAARAEPAGSGTSPGAASSPTRWSMRATGAVEDARPAEGDRSDADARTAGRADTGERGRAARDPRGNPSMADALAAERAGSEDLWSHGAGTPAAPPSEGDRVAGQGTGAHGFDQDIHPGPAPHDGDHGDGVFHRVAHNARRLGQLFGQPSPGEEPERPARETKPQLELDHGTGEQERLGDTPNGVPSQRPRPPEPVREAEAPARGEPGGSESGGTRGWRRLAKVVTGGATPVRSDLPPSDIERLRTPLDGPRSLVVLGCTGGAGQTVTALMIGHTLAAHRDDLVVAVDVNPGPNGLSRRVGAQTPETLTALLANADGIGDYARMSDYTSQSGTGLEVIQTLDDPYVQTLDDRDYGQLASLLGSFYGVTLLDPAATGVARALPVADGLVLVAPANADAERAVSMTFDWLDGNGYHALRANSVLVVNGVSKRSLADVDAAERVARGRCRAIVRIPWDDHLGSSYTKIDVGALRPATKRAHGALGGVLVNALVR
ncbi:TcpE family conjugal transfer membrane protein [Nocardiopsis sp. NPDC058631]|uniref:TcpE family conjugal transfer membrane protein n=1 Tax=Nocardiopsis sp. NPDC058631 TaxID=3346566 RepID=UPI003651165C